MAVTIQFPAPPRKGWTGDHTQHCRRWPSQAHPGTPILLPHKHTGWAGIERLCRATIWCAPSLPVVVLLGQG